MVTMYICRWRLGVVSLTALTDAGVYVSVNLPGIIAIIFITIINTILPFYHVTSWLKSPSSKWVILINTKIDINIHTIHNHP